MSCVPSARHFGVRYKKLPSSAARLSPAAAASRLRFGVVLLVATCVLVVAVWFLTDSFADGDRDGFERFQPYAIPATVPRVSYVASTFPANVLFGVLMPLGCAIIWNPFLEFFALVVALAVRCGVPPSQALPTKHCVRFACQSCWDTERLVLDNLIGDQHEKEDDEEDDDEDDEERATAGGASAHYRHRRRHHHHYSSSSLLKDNADDEEYDNAYEEENKGSGGVGGPLYAPPECTCVPYLPYAVASLRPLCRVVILGLAALSVFSLGWGLPSIVAHYVGAICFFWGIVSLHGLTLFTLHRLVKLAPVGRPCCVHQHREMNG
jgi:hypothetical protein